MKVLLVKIDFEIEAEIRADVSKKEEEKNLDIVTRSEQENSATS